jgi:type 1 glutamine amidotransferase
MDLAKSLDVNVTPDNLNQLISREPLKNILEPIEPGTGVVKFKGNVSGGGMTVDQARATVDANAKAAMKRRM